MKHIYEKGTISINKIFTQGIKGRQIIQATKTRKGNRTLPLDEMTLNFIKKWRNVQREELFILGFNTNSSDQLMYATRNNTHKSLNTPSKWMKPIIEKYNLPKITVHGFRHSHASALFSSGATIKEVQERLGHEDAQTILNIYTHVTDGQNREAIKRHSQFLNF